MENPQESDKNKLLPFKVPENYFKDLPLRINRRLERPQPLISLSRRINPKLAFAATAFFLLFSAVIWNFMPSHNQNPDQILSGVPEQAIQDYLDLEAYNSDGILAMVEPDILLYDVFLPDDYLIYEDALEWGIYDETENFDF